MVFIYIFIYIHGAHLTRTSNLKTCRRPNFMGMFRGKSPWPGLDLAQMCVTMTRSWGICPSLVIYSLLPQCTFVFLGFPLFMGPLVSDAGSLHRRVSLQTHMTSLITPTKTYCNLGNEKKVNFRFWMSYYRSNFRGLPRAGFGFELKKLSADTNLFPPYPSVCLESPAGAGNPLCSSRSSYPSVTLLLTRPQCPLPSSNTGMSICSARIL